jgi:transcription initiation factor TFIIIB Brf1 subunit/transcription initiation factor TFIIB
MEQDETAPEHHHETALEEIVQETRATSVRSWMVTGVIAAVLLVAMYAMTVHRVDEDAARRSSGVTQSQPAEVPGIPRPGGA